MGFGEGARSAKQKSTKQPEGATLLIGHYLSDTANSGAADCAGLRCSSEGGVGINIQRWPVQWTARQPVAQTETEWSHQSETVLINIIKERTEQGCSKSDPRCHKWNTVLLFTLRRERCICTIACRGLIRSEICRCRRLAEVHWKSAGTVAAFGERCGRTCVTGSGWTGDVLHVQLKNRRSQCLDQSRSHFEG